MHPGPLATTGGRITGRSLDRGGRGSIRLPSTRSNKPRSQPGGSRWNLPPLAHGRAPRPGAHTREEAIFIHGSALRGCRMGRWFFLGLVLVTPAVLAACPAAPPAGGALPAAVQYRVEGPAVSLQAQELSNPTPWAEKGDYWLVYQDPVTIGIDLPFRPDGDERARLETRIRQSLQGAGIRDLDWAGHRVRIDLDLPPGIHQLALGGIEGLERAGLDRALWLERTRRYEVMAWKPGVPASAAERATQLDLPAGAEGVGPVVADRDFLVAGGNLQGPVDLLRTLWSWTPGASEATALPGVYAVNTARWITQDRLWVAHEAHLVVDVTTGAVEPAAAAGAADVAVHPDGRTALFEVVLDDGDAWPWTWRWRL